MDNFKTVHRLPLLLLFGISTLTSLLAMGHYGKLWRPPNRSEMNAKVNHFNIVPDIIDKKQNLTFIHVKYRQTVTVMLGNKVAPEAIGDPPSNITWKVKSDNLHTLLLVDADWPIKKPPTYNQFPHWMVGNIPGTDVEKGDTIMEYVGYRATTSDEHPHRYVFLVYTQRSNEPIKFTEPRLNDKQIRERETFQNFSAKMIAAKYNLMNIGLNFMLVYHKEPYEDTDALLDRFKF